MDVLRLLVTSVYIAMASAVRMDVDDSTNGMTVTCVEETTDAQRIGTITSLVLETMHKEEVTTCVEFRAPFVQDKAVVKPVVILLDTGYVEWGSQYTDMDRLSVNGTIRPGKSSMSVVYKTVRCWDGPSLICVARGDQGTVDSPRHYMKMEVAPYDVTIYGGQSCPSSQVSRDGCDMMAQDGDTMELTCSVRVGQPLHNNFVTWHVKDSPEKMIGDFRTEMKNSSVASCEGELTSKLSYSFKPQQGSDLETITCSVAMDRQTDKMVVSKQFTVCRSRTSSHVDSWFPADGVYSRKHIIGIFFAGFGSLLVLLILILLIMCCCGCRLGVKRKNDFDLTDGYPSKG